MRNRHSTRRHAWLNCSSALHEHYLGRAVIDNNCWLPHRLESCRPWQWLACPFAWNLLNLWSDVSRHLYKSDFLRARNELHEHLFTMPFFLFKCLLGARTSWSSLMAGSVIWHQRSYAKWAQVTARANFLFPLPLMYTPSGKFCTCAGSLAYWPFTPDLSSNKLLLTLLSSFPWSTIWYELQARDWPITNQPVEATIWQVGSGEGVKKVLAEISLGKEVSVSWTCSCCMCRSSRAGIMQQ